MTKETFTYGLNACAVTYHNGKKLYEHDDLVKCFEDLELFEQDPKTVKVLKMRDATPEERESIDKYIKSISKPTGVAFWDLEQEPKTDVLDKIRAEIEQIEINGNLRDVECFNAGMNAALNVIDKYRKESEGRE